MADIVARPLAKSFIKSHGNWEFPDASKKANYHTILRKSKEDLVKYKQVSLTLIPSEHKKISFFIVRVVEHRSRLHGDVVESPSLEILT